MEGGMEHKAVELKEPTKSFALRILKLIRALPEARIVSSLVLRSATSVAANYRAACRARSRAEFSAKLGVGVEEVDKSAFWLELRSDAQLRREARLPDLRSKANQLLTIFNPSRTTAGRGFQSTIKNSAINH
jgi:four helix bundle protein